MRLLEWRAATRVGLIKDYVELKAMLLVSLHLPNMWGIEIFWFIVYK